MGNKFVKLLISFAVVFSFTSVSYFSANTSADTISDLPSKDVNTAKLLVSFMEFDKDAQEVVITDEERLSSFLKSNNFGISLQDAKHQLEQLNSTFAGENGMERKNQLDNSLQTITNEALQTTKSPGVSTMDLSCSDALTIVGFFHTSSYTTIGAAATAAGFAVNPWALAALSIMAAGSYAAGAVFGCD